MNSEITRKVIMRPFDAHLHLRSGELLKSIFVDSVFLVDALIMGNLSDDEGNPIPVDNLERLSAYRHEINSVGRQVLKFFKPVMTIMLTPRTTVETIRECAYFAKTLKFIPGKTSTGSEGGVALEALQDYYPVFEEVRSQGMTFAIHAERLIDDNGKEIPEEYREVMALPYVHKLIQDMPGLKISIEHVSTKEACELVMKSQDNVVGTITAHHVYFDEMSLYDADRVLVPGFYCKPVLKKQNHKQAVIRAMLSGSPKFFFGSDSAPHPWEKKFGSAVPAAGIFSAPVAIGLITEIFAKHNKLGLLENFFSVYGRNFYDIAMPNSTIMITNGLFYRKKIPNHIGRYKVPVLRGGTYLEWNVVVVKM